MNKRIFDELQKIKTDDHLDPLSMAKMLENLDEDVNSDQVSVESEDDDDSSYEEPARKRVKKAPPKKITKNSRGRKRNITPCQKTVKKDMNKQHLKAIADMYFDPEHDGKLKTLIIEYCFQQNINKRETYNLVKKLPSFIDKEYKRGDAKIIKWIAGKEEYSTLLDECNEYAQNFDKLYDIRVQMLCSLDRIERNIDHVERLLDDYKAQYAYESKSVELIDYYVAEAAFPKNMKAELEELASSFV